MGWHQADLGQNGFRFGGWVREVDMYLLARDRTSVGRDSLEMNVYALFFSAVQNGCAQPPVAPARPCKKLIQKMRSEKKNVAS
jgi:hypothetical protein